MAEPVRRTSEIEEFTNLHFIHPISSRLTSVFAALHVRPNAVSLAGMACGVLAGFAYSHYQDLRYAVLGFILMIAWHVMDGADGQLARLTHTQSEIGKILDGICDYVTFIAVYLGLSISLARQYGPWVWGIAVAAGLCHAFQAAAYEAQRQEYEFWGWGRKSKQLSALNPVPPAAATSGVQRALGCLNRLYGRVQFMTGAKTVVFHHKMAVILDSHPQHAALVRQKYREAFAPSVRQWSVMSANYRTAAIFIFACLKFPMAYFLWEIVVLNVIQSILSSGQVRRYSAFVEGAQTGI